MATQFGPRIEGKPGKLPRRVLHLIRQKYCGSESERFGPTLAAEHLAEEDGNLVDHETLRLSMLGEGVWSRRRKRQKYCQRRERKAHFGELVQLDGSFHDRFEGRGPRGCLMHMVDDATNQSLARMEKEETIWAAAGVLRAWMEKHGVRQALYTDGKNVYKRKATPAEKLRGKVPFTQFGRMCQKLRIEIVAASSPQAKGRVAYTRIGVLRSCDERRSPATKGPTNIWQESICRSTTDALREKPPSPRIITAASRGLASCERFFA
jgi:hypothetical protein